MQQVLQQREDAGDEAAGRRLVAEQLAQLPDQQAQADAVEVADQDRSREEAGDESGAGQAGDDGEQPDHDRDDHRQVHQALRVARRQRVMAAATIAAVAASGPTINWRELPIRA